MGMFRPKPGTIFLHSKKDPRWNWNTHVDALLFSGGMPKEVSERIKVLKAKYGEPPDDLEWGGMKD